MASNEQEEWELSKENVQPLRQGRKITNLTAALQTQSANLKEECQRFEMELRTYSGDDPLSVWYSYVLWIEQNFPKGGRSKLTQLLEQCVTLFKDEEKYRNDARYLDIWIKFARICSEPSDIFSFMFNNKIGSGMAAFYEAWASEAERQGNTSKADNLYRQGIESCAYPLGLLEKRRREFQARVANQTANEPLTDDTAAQAEAENRTCLGQLRGHGKTKKVGSVRTSAPRPAMLAGTGQAGQSLGNVRGPGFSIYTEPENRPPVLPPQSSEWSAVPSRSTVNRENELKPGKWTDAKVRSRVPSNVPTKPDFQVHEDEETALPTATPRKVMPEVNQVLSARKPEKPSNPLHQLMKQSGSGEIKTMAMYCKHLVYTGTQEFSLEEIRAAYLIKKEEQRKMQCMQEARANMEKELREQREQLAALKEQVQQEAQKIRIPQANPEFVRPSKGVASGPEQLEVLTEKLSALEFLQEMAPAAAPLNTAPRTNLETRPQRESSTVFTPPMQPTSNQKDTSTDLSSKSGDSVKDSPAGPVQVGLVRPGIPTPETSSLHTLNYSGFTSSEPGSSDPTPDKLQPCPRRPSSFSSTTSSGGLTAPSPTINTKQAREMVLGMFNQTFTDIWSKPSIPKTSPDISLGHGEPIPSVPAPAPFTIFEEVQEPLKASTSSLMPQKNIGVSCDQEVGSERRPFQPRAQSTTHEAKPAPLTANPATTQDDPYFPMEYSQLLREEDDVIMDDDRILARPRMSGVNLDGQLSALSFAPQLSSTQNFTDMARLISTPYNPMKSAPDMPALAVSFISGDADRHLAAERLTLAQDHTLAPCRTGHQLEASSPVSHTDQSSSAAANTQSSVGQSVMNYTDAEGYAKKNLSPITECSDEDTNLGLSSMAASHVQHQIPTSDTLHSTSNVSSTSSKRGPSKFTISDTIHEGQEEEESQSPPPPPSSPPRSQAMNQTCHEIDVTTYHHDDEDDTEDLLSQSIMVNPFSDPFDEDLLQRLLRTLDVPLERLPNYHRVYESLPAIKPKKVLNLGDVTFNVIQRHGEGAFAKIYTVQDRRRSDMQVIKVQTPPCPWEFYITEELHKRLQEQKLPLRSSIMHIDDAYFYDNGSCFVNELHRHGTILDMVNVIRGTGKRLPESVILYLCLEMLRILEATLQVNIIHGDVKPDNILFRGLPQIADMSQAVHGETQCLKLIDFGRGIDMRLFPPGTSFGVCVETSGFQCIEMKTRRPWTYQTDMFGMVGTMHVVIFGEYMNVMYDGQRWKPTSRFKRWFGAQSLMKKIFDELLNVKSCTDLPDVSSLRRELETTLISSYNYNEDLGLVDPSLRKH